jgi:hypothetical protein
VGNEKTLSPAEVFSVGNEKISAGDLRRKFFRWVMKKFPPEIEKTVYRQTPSSKKKSYFLEK